MLWLAAGLCLSAALCVLAALVFDAFAALRRLPPAVLLALLPLAFVSTLEAQKTNGLMQAVHQFLQSSPRTVTDEEIARGWRMESVSTDATTSLEMPSGASLVGNWHIHGARTSFGGNKVEFPGFSFPLGTNSTSSFWYFVDGCIRPTPRDELHEIRAAGGDMFAAPNLSRLWTAAEPDGSRVITWESFFMGEGTNTPVSAQIRLCPNGDIVTRSNSVETVYRRVNPRDFDGDGIVNERDLNQYSYGGNYFGVGNAIPAGADTNAYYWLELVPTGALGVAEISVTCDGQSDLGGHWVIARTNETCRVPLLAGATYSVHSDLPIGHSSVSSEYANIETNSETSLTVSLPLTLHFERVPMRGGTANYDAYTLPIDVHPHVLSVIGGCCSCEANADGGITWTCWSWCYGCPVSGHDLYVTATWQGYQREFLSEVRCPQCEEWDGGVEEDEHGAFVGIAFTPAVVVFENAYTNAPGEAHSRRSSATTLICRAAGGQFGGSVAVTVSNGGKILWTGGDVLPGSFSAPAGQETTLYAEFDGVEASGAVGDIVATAVFSEYMTGRQLTNETTLTSVRAELTAQVKLSEQTKNRHCFGVAETVLCQMTPSGVPGLAFSAVQGTYDESSGQWICPVSTTMVMNGLAVTRGGETVYPFITSTTPPTAIVAEHGVGLDFGVPPGTAGGAGMQLELYILPKTVSFSKLSLVEVPTMSEEPTGYFTDNFFSAVWYHTVSMGAGEWHDMKGGGFWFPDKPRMGDALPSCQDLVWASGTIIWNIPIAWELKTLKGTDYSKRIPVVYTQRFDFNASGTLRVTKFDYWAERDADNTKRGSEGIRIWVPYQP